MTKYKITHGIGLDSGMFLKYKKDIRTRGHGWALAIQGGDSVTNSVKFS